MLDALKRHWWITLSERDRPDQGYRESLFLVRAWTAWGALEIASEQARLKGPEWVVYRMERV